MKLNKDIISVPAQFDDVSKLGGGLKGFVGLTKSEDLPLSW